MSLWIIRACTLDRPSSLKMGSNLLIFKDSIPQICKAPKNKGLDIRRSCESYRNPWGGLLWTLLSENWSSLAVLPPSIRKAGNLCQPGNNLPASVSVLPSLFLTHTCRHTNWPPQGALPPPFSNSAEFCHDWQAGNKSFMHGYCSSSFFCCCFVFFPSITAKENSTRRRSWYWKTTLKK